MVVVVVHAVNLLSVHVAHQVVALQEQHLLPNFDCAVRSLVGLEVSPLADYGYCLYADKICLTGHS